MRTGNPQTLVNKRDQVAGFLTHANVTHRHAQLAGDGHYHSALSGAVEFRKYDPSHARRLRELPRLLQSILARGRVHHQ